MSSRKVLVAPLDWGLGHASRMVPLIQFFIDRGWTVELASDKLPYDFLHEEFPSLKMHRFPSYNIKYTRHQFLMVSLICQAPKMFFGGLREKRWLDKYIDENKPDMVISDDCFGMYSKRVRCYYVTHQVRVLMPAYLKALQPFARLVHRWIIGNYNACLIPDFNSDGISGLLSHKSNEFNFPVKYLGPLSRFQKYPLEELDNVKMEIPDVLIVLSGPEPQRTLLKNKLVDLYRSSSLKVFMLEGLPNLNNSYSIGNILVIPHCDSFRLAVLLRRAPVLIMRSGYSSLMDLFYLKRKAIIIPTPGQTEQVYLANHLSEKYNFITYKQSQDFKIDMFRSEFSRYW